MIRERFQNYLNLRFPAMTTYRHASLLSIAAVACVAMIFLFFQPFGMNMIEAPHRLLKITAYALPYFPVVWGYCLLVVYFIRKNDLGNKWLLKHELLSNIALMLLLGIVNFITLVPVLEKDYSLYTFLEIIGMTAVVTLVPIAVMTGIELIQFQYRNQTNVAGGESQGDALSKGESSEDQFIILHGHNKDESLELGLQHLLFVQSQGNYVEVVVESVSSQITKEIIRISLKDIISQLSEVKSIQRVHRSFLVNTSRIVDAHGNAHGMSLWLGDTRIKVPVSRKFIDVAKPYESKHRKRKLTTI